MCSKVSEAKGYKCIMERGPWRYLFGSSFYDDVVITILIGKKPIYTHLTAAEETEATGRIEKKWHKGC